MTKPNSFSGNNLIPTAVVVILAFVLLIILLGKKDDNNDADFNVSGSIQKGVFVNNDWFSAEVARINRNIAGRYNISPGTKGVVVVELEGNRDVMMKLRKGDVITAINNRKIKNLRDFRKASKGVNPIEGMFIDIQRNGYPMYISVSGAGRALGSQPVQFQNPQPFYINQIAPVLGTDVNLGGINSNAGIFGNQIEKWINNNFGRGFYACLKCGTMVPDNRYPIKGGIFCPNCGAKMVLKQ